MARQPAARRQRAHPPGLLLYRVESGDNLTSIVRKLRDFTPASSAQVVAANPKITDPDVIAVGRRLRIPQKG